jgi:hypothetical protein
MRFDCSSWKLHRLASFGLHIAPFASDATHLASAARADLAISHNVLCLSIMSDVYAMYHLYYAAACRANEICCFFFLLHSVYELLISSSLRRCLGLLQL